MYKKRILNNICEVSCGEKRVGFGRVINVIDILIMAISLLGNAFELLSITTFRIMIFFGILVQGIGLVYILKKKEF